MEHTNYNSSNNNNNISSSYSYNDVHCEEEETIVVNVPFSWEHKPGLSKASTTHGQNGTSLVLQPPPSSSSLSDHHHHHHHHRHNKVEEDSHILRAVQTSFRISSFRIETPKEEDPFVEAYKKCTQSPFVHQKNIRSWPTLRKYVNIFSCKHSDDVCS